MKTKTPQSAPACSGNSCSCSGDCPDIASEPQSGPSIKKGLLPLLPGGLLYLLLLVLYVLSYFLVGAGIVKTAVSSILKGRPFDEFFLMTVATAGAFAIGAY